MCTAATAKRRRRQMRLDKRYKGKDPLAAARRSVARAMEKQSKGKK